MHLVQVSSLLAPEKSVDLSKKVAVSGILTLGSIFSSQSAFGFFFFFFFSAGHFRCIFLAHARDSLRFETKPFGHMQS